MNYSEKEEEEAIEVSQEFHVSAKRLWKALTRLEEMKQWFFPEIPDFKAEVGFSTGFMVDAGQRRFFHQWELLKVEPAEEIVYRWDYQGYSGHSFVHFILRNNSKTELVVKHYGVQNFPQHIPEFHPESCRRGWEYFIQKRLYDYLRS
ncbi:SRPBCC family protein [Robertkochia aurantiaca]|uniref:SRPBCC family protein n=1 Tax=Robertkochia aurantiaca TaxID=2873700 RepID=UPI001CCA51D1|nr:SRPBCC domain-containing protein [Robertkochia sp. 3YJGBD-33]